ncbi:MAG TPA: aconitase/3-isopropylmalate dehydratase large subunit family protein [Thermoanaerobaculia bacterium]|nr:aconitase/3-isopropylmalate dehydratase large subunit family protein [Thermoanaerobaculia bacterium]
MSGHTPRTFAQKALARAAGLASVEVGQVVDARPDLALSHDNTAAIRQIWLRFGRERVAIPERMAITLDHAVPAPTPRHAQNHAEVRRFVAEQGVAHFFEVGRGICHQVFSEEALLEPGQLILGSDSHTPHFGWMGAFGAGVGRSEMAVIWATGELWLRVPESLRIELHGTPPPWVSAKDAALHIIGALGEDGGLYASVEVVGEAVRAFSLESRMALANMMAEMGAKTSYLEPDDVVFRFLAERRLRRLSDPDAADGATAPPEAAIDDEIARLRAGAFYPDPDARYSGVHRFDLSRIPITVARPHRVDRTIGLEQLGAIHVDQAFIGTCTNGRLEDLEIAHRILKGRHVAAGTRLLIVPASSEVLTTALQRGWVEDLVQAGAHFGTPGCGPCMGNHQGVLAPGEVCISSANRNFKGRMAEPDAEIYLASPAVVAASAILGRIASPAEVMDE